MIVARNFVKLFCLILLLTFSSVAFCQVGDSSLPSAEEVMDQHILAVGGYELLESLSTTHVVWECSKGNKVWRYEAWKIPGQQYARRLLNGEPEYEYGCVVSESRGKWAKLHGVAWRQRSGNSVSMHRGSELQSWLRDTCVMATNVHWREAYKSVRCVGTAKINNVDCYHLRCVLHDEVESHRYYDIKTGYLIRHIGVDQKADGSVVTRTYSDHERCGDVVVARTLKSSSDRGTYVWKLEEIEWDEELDMDLFFVPEQVRIAIDKVNSRLKVSSLENSNHEISQDNASDVE
jgi:hypothetical protein